MTITVYTDGGSRGNPGPAAYGYIIYGNNRAVAKGCAPIGRQTNNFAEYTGLIKALEKIKQILSSLKPVEKIIVYADSNLMVNQMKGLYKIKNAAIGELVMQARLLEKDINIPVSYIHIPREKNTLADSLVNQALS